MWPVTKGAARSRLPRGRCQSQGHWRMGRGRGGGEETPPKAKSSKKPAKSAPVEDDGLDDEDEDEDVEGR